MCIDDETVRLEKEIVALKAKVVELKGFEKRLREQYEENISLSIELDTVKHRKTIQTEINRSLERKNKLAVVIKTEPVEEIELELPIMSAEQKKKCRHEIDQVHRDYTQLSRSKRYLQVVTNSKERLVAVLEKFKRDNRKQTEMSDLEVTQHNKFIDRLNKENIYLKRSIFDLLVSKVEVLRVTLYREILMRMKILISVQTH